MVRAVSIEAVMAPIPDDGSESPIFAQYRELLPTGLEIKRLKRFDFYEAVNKPELVLMIATGEKRPYACILLTVGIRKF